MACLLYPGMQKLNSFYLWRCCITLEARLIMKINGHTQRVGYWEILENELMTKSGYVKIWGFSTAVFFKATVNNIHVLCQKKKPKQCFLVCQDNWQIYEMKKKHTKHVVGSHLSQYVFFSQETTKRYEHADTKHEHYLPRPEAKCTQTQKFKKQSQQWHVAGSHLTQNGSDL